ncbi:MAG: Dabb family protein [Acidimicrobiales bacterium]
MRWKPDATPEQRQAVLEAAGRLPGQIPEIRSYLFGPDAGVSAGTWDLAIVADFDDADGYRRYADHPVHRAMVEGHVQPILAERAAVQHELAGR